MSAFEKRLDYKEGRCKREEELLATGEVAWVVLSGKMASGKDTFAPRLKLPGNYTEIISYGSILRENLSLVIDWVPTWKTMTFEEVVKDTQSFTGYTEKATEEFVRMLLLHEDLENLNPYERTPYMRSLLQNMGSIWLPHKDYLPSLAASRACSAFKHGDSVVAAGSRFLPDVDIPRLAGGITVRIDVSEETQLRRLKERDGLEATPELFEAMHHEGELALDDYPHDIRVSNDEDGEDALAEVIAKVNDEIEAIMEARRKSS